LSASELKSEMRGTECHVVVLFPIADPFAGPASAEQYGLPPLDEFENPLFKVDEDGFSCSRAEFFAALENRQPAFRPYTQPLYANTPFVILGYALESLTGKSFKENLQAMSDTVGLQETVAESPNPFKGVIPYDLESAIWTLNFGKAAPLGGPFCLRERHRQNWSLNSNSTPLDASTTRAWLKPTSFIPNLRSAIGRPWEIYRFDASASEHSVIDMYGKGGDAKPSHSWIGLLPDYNIGVALVIGGPDNKDWINDQIFEIVYQTLKAAARGQAEVAYAGTYRTSHGLSPTITLTTEAGKPGLGIVQWFSNGTDVSKVLTQLSDEPLTSDNFRLMLKNLERSLDNGGEKVLWSFIHA
jgi:hypothetical protein